MSNNLINKPFFHILIILVLGIICYSNTLHSPFELDDTSNIENNPIVKNLEYYQNPAKAQKYKASWGYPMLVNRYVGSLSFALNYKVHALNVTGYHIVNIAIHLINSLLLYWLVTTMLAAVHLGNHAPGVLAPKNIPALAFLVALLFATHPIQTQAVTYVVQRFTSLATLFYLLAVVTYMKARLSGKDDKLPEHGHVGSLRFFSYYAVSLISSVLAMKTKEISFTLPAILALTEFLFLHGKLRARIIYQIPFVLSALIIPFTLMFVGDYHGTSGSVTRLASDLPRLDYLFTELRVIITYLKLIFLPINQNLDYDYPIYHSIFDKNVLLSLLALASIFFTAAYAYYRKRKSIPEITIVFWGVCWLFITLSIESSIIPIKDVIFEHRMYLPSVGLFIAISTILAILLAGKTKVKTDYALVSFAVTISLILTVATFSRNAVWSDKLELWKDVVSKSPNKARAVCELGLSYAKSGDIDKAIANYLKAISLDDSLQKAHYNLGCAYLKKGWPDLAIDSLKNAIRLRPSDDSAYNNLGISFLRKELIGESISAFRNAVSINPSHPDYHYNLGVALSQKGFTEEANQEFRSALVLNPSYPGAHYNLGCAYHDQGMLDEAIREYETELEVNPSHVSAQYNLAVSYMGMGRTREANLAMQKAKMLEQGKRR